MSIFCLWFLVSHLRIEEVLDSKILKKMEQNTFLRNSPDYSSSIYLKTLHISVYLKLVFVTRIYKLLLFYVKIEV